MSSKPTIACKRCRVKKLKCDDELQTCRNCSKAGEQCIHVDSRSRREYARGYVEHLQQRIAELNRVIEKAKAPTPSGTSDARTTATSQSPVSPSAYHGEGSAIRMARLVEASIATRVPNTLLDTGVDTTRELQEAAGISATPAALPPIDIARRLFDSYLKGPHRLHPFLRQSELLEELNTAYSQPLSRSGPTMFRIHMVFAIGAVALVRAGVHNVSPLDYYVAAMDHACNTLGLRGIEHIQAVLLVLLFTLQHDIAVGSKWDLARVAMRICIECRLHKRSYHCQPMVDQMRKRIFWVCYVSDRHSSSVLGRPMAIRDQDIEVELPIDADDDLIESGNIDVQILRGPSEISPHLRQVRLRQITSRIGAQLYRKAASCHSSILLGRVNEILSDLDRWRAAFPILIRAQNAYETTHWRDLNYYRERLKCHRLLMLLREDHITGDGTTPLEACQEAASRVALLYSGMRTSETLILNWTCVHDMMSAGFTVLYCGLARQEAAQRGETLTEPWDEQASRIRGTINTIVDTLSHIATRWATVGKHVRVFKALADRVDAAMQLVPTSEVCTLGPRTTNVNLPPGGACPGVGWLDDFGYQAEMWDAAMIAFLNEPVDLGNIDWGVVDWNAAGLFSPTAEDHLSF